MKLKPNQFLLPSGALITERPIPYITPMVQANLEDRKTQTRRTKEFDGMNYCPDEFTLIRMQVYPNGSLNAVFEYEGELGSVKSPYGKPGDLLWVKEAHREMKKGCDYKSDYPDRTNFRWTPSMLMPKSASRIWAMVEAIRVERVQDISEQDAIAEGVEETIVFDDSYPNDKSKSISFFKSYLTDYWGAFGNVAGDREEEHDGAKKSFQTLWISIDGEKSWNANPWVWVIQYRILSKTGRPSLDVIAEAYDQVMGKEVVNA